MYFPDRCQVQRFSSVTSLSCILVNVTLRSCNGHLPLPHGCHHISDGRTIEFWIPVIASESQVGPRQIYIDMPK